MGNSTQRFRLGEVRSRFDEFDGPTKQTRDKFDEIVGRFELFAKRAFDAELIEAVTPECAEAFVRAKGSTGEPSIATMHLRRSCLRILFRIARREFGFDLDPTLDLSLPPRSSLSTRPLTNDEVALGLSYSLNTFTATRQPAAWALGEATAVTAELSYITIDDLDLDCADDPRVWLHGSRKRIDRWGLLGERYSSNGERVCSKALVTSFIKAVALSRACRRQAALH